MKTVILIPARLESSRFPDKMLADLNGKPLIRHVYDECVKTGYDTYVVTDSKKIASLIPNVIMSQQEHTSGTSRIVEAAKTLPDYSYFVNVQGDMPDIRKDMIDTLVWKMVLSAKLLNVTTLAKAKYRYPPSMNRNTVKVIIDSNHKANWFTRTYFPYAFDHLGVYCFSKWFIDEFDNLTTQTHASEFEGLEQLDWLWNGVPIHVSHVDFDGVEINTPEDLKEWNERETSTSKYKS